MRPEDAKILVDIPNNAGRRKKGSQARASFQRDGRDENRPIGHVASEGEKNVRMGENKERRKIPLTPLVTVEEKGHEVVKSAD